MKEVDCKNENIVGRTMYFDSSMELLLGHVITINVKNDGRQMQGLISSCETLPNGKFRIGVILKPSLETCIAEAKSHLNLPKQSPPSSPNTDNPSETKAESAPDSPQKP